MRTSYIYPGYHTYRRGQASPLKFPTVGPAASCFLHLLSTFQTIGQPQPHNTVLEGKDTLAARLRTRLDSLGKAAIP